MPLLTDETRAGKTRNNKEEEDERRK